MPSSRKQKQGKVKTGRENEREPVQASSNQLSAKRLMSIFEPYVKSEFQTSLSTHHRLRGIIQCLEEARQGSGSQSFSPVCLSRVR